MKVDQFIVRYAANLFANKYPQLIEVHTQQSVAIHECWIVEINK